MIWNAETNTQILLILLRYLASQNIRIPYAEIAAEFGVTSNSVNHRIRKLRGESTNSVRDGYNGGEGNRASETGTADGEDLASPLEMSTGKKGRRRAGGRKLPSNKVREGRVGKPGKEGREC